MQDWFSYLHESAHFWYLDWTPAKEVARLYLATSYALIVLLLTADRYEEWQWRNLLRASTRLADIAERIGFVEELVALAMSVWAMERQTRAGGMWYGCEEPLARLKAAALHEEERSFPGFSAAYERLVPLLDLVQPDRSPLSGLIPALQPITMHYDDQDADDAYREPEAIDTYTNLGMILDAARGAATGRQVLERLAPFIREVADEWRRVLERLDYGVSQPAVDVRGRTIVEGTFTHWLWGLAHGELGKNDHDSAERDIASDAISTIFTAQRTGVWRGPDVLVIAPQVYRGHPILGLSPGFAADEVHKKHETVLFYEGVRQQLLAGRGIVCPNNKGTLRCRCARRTHDRLRRLSSYALDGCFGPGEWSRLPCKR